MHCALRALYYLLFLPIGAVRKSWDCGRRIRVRALALQRRYLTEEALPRLAGAALLCSAPPSGNSALVRRLMRQSPLLAARLTWCACTRPFKEHVCRVRVGEALQRCDNWLPVALSLRSLFSCSCSHAGTGENVSLLARQ